MSYRNLPSGTGTGNLSLSDPEHAWNRDCFGEYGKPPWAYRAPCRPRRYYGHPSYPWRESHPAQGYRYMPPHPCGNELWCPADDEGGIPRQGEADRSGCPGAHSSSYPGKSERRWRAPCRWLWHYRPGKAGWWAVLRGDSASLHTTVP